MTIPRGTAADALVWQCRAAGLSDPVREYRFWPERRFRFDLAWLLHEVAVEVEGVVYSRRGAQLHGRHVSASGFQRDIEKYAEAMARGWVVLRVLPRHVHDGRALLWVERVLAHRGAQHLLITRPGEFSSAALLSSRPGGAASSSTTNLPTLDTRPGRAHTAQRTPTRPGR